MLPGAETTCYIYILDPIFDDGIKCDVLIFLSFILCLALYMYLHITIFFLVIASIFFEI